MNVKLGRGYFARVETSTAMSPLMARGFIATNFGSGPFAYPIPQGYRPFDAR
jgi:hypothetical protein